MESLNRNYRKKGKKEIPIAELSRRISSGDRFALSQGLTLIESSNTEKRIQGLSLLSQIDSDNQSIRIGITGSPGSGKSTFIESMGAFLIERGHRVAVLAIDPSSTLNQGSILGDKTRMADLSTHPDAYVRPTASSNVLGGVSRTTKEAIHLCELAGYDVIIVESVGVGQSEIEISHMVDATVLLLLPGGGDDVQGIKRGVMELADILIVNKADDDRLDLAKMSKKMYRNAVSLLLHPMKHWQQPILLNSNYDHSAAYKKEVWATLQKYISTSHEAGYFQALRSRQDERWFQNQVQQFILAQWQKRHQSVEKNEDELEKHNIFSRFTSFIEDYKNR